MEYRTEQYSHAITDRNSSRRRSTLIWLPGALGLLDSCVRGRRPTRQVPAGLQLCWFSGDQFCWFSGARPGKRRPLAFLWLWRCEAARKTLPGGAVVVVALR